MVVECSTCGFRCRYCSDMKSRECLSNCVDTKIKSAKSLDLLITHFALVPLGMSFNVTDKFFSVCSSAESEERINTSTEKGIKDGGKNYAIFHS